MTNKLYLVETNHLRCIEKHAILFHQVHMKHHEMCLTDISWSGCVRNRAVTDNPDFSENSMTYDLVVFSHGKISYSSYLPFNSSSPEDFHRCRDIIFCSALVPTKADSIRFCF